MNRPGSIRRRATAGICLGVAAAALLTACGSSSNSSGGGSDNALLLSTASDRTSQLAAEAKKEGTLNWTTSFAGPVVNDIVAGFEKAYPGIKVTVNRGDEGVIIPQVVQAIGAGKSLSDVFEVTASGALEFTDAGVLAPYESPTAAGIAGEYKVKDKNGHNLLLTDRISYISFGYNTKKLPAADVPKTLQDLTNPALKGKLAIETNTTSEDWIGAVVHQLGQNGADTFFKALAMNNVQQTALSGSAMMGLVASGQYAASPSVFHNHEQQEAGKGAPVEWMPLEPVVANVGQLGIFKNAKHPAAAMLFTDWLLGTDGQKVLEKQQYTPPSVKQPFQAWVPSEGAKSAQAFNQDLKGWAALQKKYFG
ncbi:MAG: putative binding protein component of iron transporter precursor [Actinoallomurus sp.]|nr:putative binding protein component of iron transporter precursor [Actinoallomurus sp.]